MNVGIPETKLMVWIIRIIMIPNESNFLVRKKENTFWSRTDAEDNKWGSRSLFICKIANEMKIGHISGNP